MPAFYRLIPLLALLFSLPARAQTDEISFTPEGGFFARTQGLRIGSGHGRELRYTTDGSTPTVKSPRYEGEIQIERSTVVRAARFDEAGKRVGPVRGATYLIGEPESELLTVSIGVDDWRLFNSVSGWFRAGPGADPGHWKMPGANFWTRREHPAHCEIITPEGQSVFASTTGFRMFGGMSRLADQKSFSISARKKYGDHRIRYPLFGDDGQEDFKFLVLRNGGSDGGRSNIRDALLTGLLRDQSWDLDRQAARPVRVFLNGKYWGMYHLREKINPKFLADRHNGVDKDELDLLEHEKTVKHGSLSAYQKILSLFTPPLGAGGATPTLEEVNNLMDIDNFQRLQIAQTFFANRDAGGNIRYWRPHRPEARFRWILYDVDQGFGLHSDGAWRHKTLDFYTADDGPSWPNPPWSTLLQRRLLSWPDYRRNFINRSLDYLHADFASETVLAALDSKITEVTPEMQRHLKRWRGKNSHWQAHLERIRQFAIHRPDFLREHYRQFFGLGGDRTLELSSTTGGSVRLNDNLMIGAETFGGRYFSDVPITIEAIPLPGYRLLGWSGIDESGTYQTVDLSADRAYRISARFEEALHPLADRVIVNEISPRNQQSGDWLELHNRGEETVNLQGWFLTDASQHKFSLPETTISPGGYLAVCRDEERFAASYPGAREVIGGLSFGLNRSSDRIGLYAADGAYVNAVSYHFEATDTTFTYALALPGLDNKQAENWVREANAGTPAMPNPEHLKSAVVSAQSFWMRIGVAVSVLLLIVVMGGRYRTSAEVPDSN